MLTGSASSIDSATLVGLTRFLTNTLDNVNAYSDANIVAQLNLEYRETQSFLLSQIIYDWKENTLNGTGNGLLNLTAGTNSYSFPTGMLTLDRLEINYTGATNVWVVSEPVKLDVFDLAIANTSGNTAVKFSKNYPRHWVRDGKIYIDPVPDQSITSGLKVWCTILITDLALAETVGPVFSAPFHPILAYSAAKKYFLQKQQYNDATIMEQEKMKLRAEMISFYSQREADTKPNITVKKRDLK